NGGVIGGLDNQITVTLAAGGVSRFHNFAYTLRSTSRIGDTLFIHTHGDGSQQTGGAGIPHHTPPPPPDVGPARPHPARPRARPPPVGVDRLVAPAAPAPPGHFLFCRPQAPSCPADLAFGSYIVKVDTTDPDFPAGLTPSGDPDVRTARIGGRLFQDTNRSGS